MYSEYDYEYNFASLCPTKKRDTPHTHSRVANTRLKFRETDEGRCVRRADWLHDCLLTRLLCNRQYKAAKWAH